MEPDVLAELLCERLRKAGLPESVVREFVDSITPLTLARYLTTAPKRHHPPTGARLNMLWHLLAFVGVHSPELQTVDAFGHYIGELLAWKVITLADAVDLCGLTKTNVQGAWRITRSPNPPAKPKEPLADIREVYDEELEKAKTALRAQLGDYQPPAELQEPAAAALPAPAEEPPAVPQPTPPLAVVLPSAVRALPVPLELASVQPAGSPVSAVDLHHLVEISAQVGALLPSLRFLLQYGTREDRATVRKLLNETGMFELANLADQLCGERAKTIVEGR